MPAQCCKDKWPQIPDDEPVFILRGKDLLVLPIVHAWMEAATGAGVNDNKMEAVGQHYAAIQEFQRAHPERCKIPD
jgi:hypothetical protein